MSARLPFSKIRSTIPWIAAISLSGIFIAGMSADSVFFGINQYRNLSFLLILAGASAIALPFVPAVRNMLRKLIAAKISSFAFVLMALLVSVASFFIFSEFSTSFINFDGELFDAKFRRDYHDGKVHIVHDEMLELYVHFKFWVYSWKHWDWTVEESYRFLSCCAGSAFVFIVSMLGWEAFRIKVIFFLPFVFCGAGIALFFGDVENYSLTAVFLAGFLWTGLRSSRTTAEKFDANLIVAGTFLGLAVSFHLLAGWLIPGFLFLVWRRLRTNPAGALLSLALMTMIPLSVIFWMENEGLPVGNLFAKSNLFGQGQGTLSMFVSPSGEYYYWLSHLVLLLLPLLPFLVSILISNFIRWTGEMKFLGFCGFFLFVFMVTWNAAIGIYHDWSLFANCGLVLSVFTGFAFLRSEQIKNKWILYPLAVVPPMLHTSGWIWYNHIDGNPPLI